MNVKEFTDDPKRHTYEYSLGFSFYVNIYNDKPSFSLYYNDMDGIFDPDCIDEYLEVLSDVKLKMEKYRSVAT